MQLLSTIRHFSSTALLLSLISTLVIVEAQPSANGEDWQAPHQEATGGWGIEHDVNDQQLMFDDRNEEKHESTGSGFVTNALAAGVGTLLASGIANYAGNGYPYTTGVGYNNMGGAYVPGAYVSGAGAYMPGAVYGPGAYVPTAGTYMPGTYVPGAGPYYPVAPGYGVMSTGYRPLQTRDRGDSDAPDSIPDLADFGNSYPAYYSELLSGNAPPKTEAEAPTVPVDAGAESSAVKQQDFGVTSSRGRYPIDWSAVAHHYYRSMNAD
ncbi:uncharacterized protein LOC130692806 [Daphnia carinata]|uniref:uncharacterized protein LOC130692806 n=1 Tax=Daphnia carinata TaxID=120202 RepID=UPI0025796FDE|nr:uncharacterized protein LOC130692806 [Daphnia carinata]